MHPFLIDFLSFISTIIIFPLVTSSSLSATLTFSQYIKFQINFISDEYFLNKNLIFYLCRSPSSDNNA